MLFRSTLFSQAFSEALFNNKKEVTADDVRHAIEHSNAVYPDVVKKSLVKFDEEFDELITKKEETIEEPKKEEKPEVNVVKEETKENNKPFDKLREN